MTEDPLIGRQLADFRIDSLLGRGGMGAVYKGWDVQLDRPVAVKVVDTAGQENVNYAERLVKEARAVARWRHEHVIQVYSAGTENSLYYFVMEYVEGKHLGDVMSQYILDGEYMPHDEVIRLGNAIAAALDYSHEQGVIHRDVKPGNVMISVDGRVVLADFGLALDVEQGTLGEVFGSAHYIAPEQARRSSDAVPQSDLYSLGIILYEMLTGTVPFDDPSPMSTALQHISHAPPPPRQVNPYLNEATEAVLLTALNKSPGDRYQTGAELMQALTAALQGETAGVVAETVPLPTPPIVVTRPAEPEPMPEPHHEPPKDKPKKSGFPIWLLAGGGGLAFVVVVLLVIAFIGRDYIFGLFSGDEPAAEVTQPAEASASATPVTVVDVPTTVPTVADVAPTETAPTEPAPTEAAPTEAAPTEAAPTEAVPTEALATDPAAGPTALPDGYRIVLLYTDADFFMWNAGEQRIYPSRLAFEAIDATTGTPTEYRYEGWRWDEVFKDGYLDAGKCDVLLNLALSSNASREECERVSFPYSASRNTSSDFNPEWRFWLSTYENVTHFSVLWRDNSGEEYYELARCEIAAQECEVYLPQ